MNGVRTKNGDSEKTDGGAPSKIRNEIKAPRFDADRLFTMLGGFVPLAEQKAFVEWLNSHPRATENLSRGLLTSGELNAAYQQYVRETKKGDVKTTALATIDSRQLAAMVNVPQEEVEALLEIYNPEYLKSLGILSQRCESDFDTATEIDGELLDDGSYAGRLEETKEVVLAYEALKSAVNDELAAAGSLERKRMLDTPLDMLWDKLLGEYEGDELKAAKVYAKETEARLKGVEAVGFLPVVLDKKFIVEI